MRLVMKFGGYLLDNENKLNNVVNIIKSYYSLGNEIVVIISALHGITDNILDICYHIKKVNKNSLCLFLKVFILYYWK